MERTHAFRFLSAGEARFLDAALARLIPADDLGPGAREADVTSFIDQRLAGGFGAHARQYRAGPWADGTPEQGWQSPLTPREVYRYGIAETDAHCVAQHGAAFHRLAASAQDALLQALERGQVALPSLASTLFFELLWRHAQEGFFADPRHGGNRDMVGWRLIGFPGVAASAYPAAMAQFGVAYRAQPVSIGDVAEGRVPLDAHGNPLHRPFADG